MKNSVMTRTTRMARACRVSSRPSRAVVVCSRKSISSTTSGGETAIAKKFMVHAKESSMETNKCTFTKRYDAYNRESTTVAKCTGPITNLLFIYVLVSHTVITLLNSCHHECNMWRLYVSCTSTNLGLFYSDVSINHTSCFPDDVIIDVQLSKYWCINVSGGRNYDNTSCSSSRRAHAFIEKSDWLCCRWWNHIRSIIWSSLCCCFFR